MSCAGGVSAKVIIPVKREKATGVQATICVDGLLGGHSGMEIDKEHGNANILIGRVLYDLARLTGYKLVEVNGGSKDNAICKKADARILASSEDREKIADKVAEMATEISRELRAADPGVTLTVDFGDTKEEAAMDSSSRDKVIAWLMNTPTGIQHMSKEIEGLVETSLNLGALTTLNDEITALYALRSAVETRKEYLCRRLESLAGILGGKVEYSGEYPGWEYRADSALRDTCVEVFKKQYGKEPQIEAIHAGLECGLFAGKMNDGDFDAVSIGPDMTGVHTTDEKLSIASVGRTWKYLLGVLEACK